MNQAIIIGNLGRDPEVRQTQTSKTVVRLSVATTYKGKGEPETEWHSVTVFGSQADACEKYLAKGSKVAVTGRIRTQCYEKDGIKRYSTEIVANSVEFLSSRDDRPSSRNSSRPAPDIYPEDAFGDDDIPF